MGTILTNKGQLSLIAGWLSGESDVADPTSADEIVPAAGAGEWGVGLGVNGVDIGDTPIGTDKTANLADIIEIGQATAEGYARQPLDRNDAVSGWPVPSALVSGSYQTTAPEVVFGPFTGAPNANDAAFWFVAGSTTTGDDNILFGADLAAVRTFTAGSTERVTATFRVV
jgi:hypothetical protein